MRASAQSFETRRVAALDQPFQFAVLTSADLGLPGDICFRRGDFRGGRRFDCVARRRLHERAKSVEVAAADARDQAERAFAALGRLKNLSGAHKTLVETAIGQRQACLSLIDALAVAPVGAIKTRIHGDYHLGQVLIVQDDVMIVDFEGEPARPADERRAKASPLRDVAGMLRSFAYAADTATRDVGLRLPESAARIAPIATEWLRLTESSFLRAYEEAASDSAVWVSDAATRARLLRLHLLGKALYEVNYEANNRPDWIETPLRGVLSILEQGAA